MESPLYHNKSYLEKSFLAKKGRVQTVNPDLVSPHLPSGIPPFRLFVFTLLPAMIISYHVFICLIRPSPHHTWQPSPDARAACLAENPPIPPTTTTSPPQYRPLNPHQHTAPTAPALAEASIDPHTFPHLHVANAMACLYSHYK